MTYYEKIKDPYFRNFFKNIEETTKRSAQQSAEAVSEKTDFERAILQISRDIRAPFFPPDRQIKINEKINVDSLNYVFPSQMLRHYIRTASNRFIMDVCGCRLGGQCKHFPIDLGCLFIGDAAAEFNKELGHLVSVEEALAHTQKWLDAGLSLHLGYVPIDAYAFKAQPPDKLMSICGCCPCCCITRFFPYSRMPGLEIQVTEKCSGCGACVEVCGYNAIEFKDDKAVIDDKKCLGCGRCVDRCPEEAIEVVILDPEYVQKTMNWINERVDVT
jgi:NAD-dependent dihydropyrimidine dehydrogenase PreA subunit